MGKYSVNSDRLINEVKPILGLARTYLVDAMSTITTITLPSSCSYNIKSINNQISPIAEAVQSIESWIGNEVSLYLETENNNEKLIEMVLADMENTKKLNNFVNEKETKKALVDYLRQYFGLDIVYEFEDYKDYEGKRNGGLWQRLRGIWKLWRVW